MKNEEEEQVLKSRINRLNDLRPGATPKSKDGGTGGGGSGGGGGTGIISTWKKLKGKKKKQRNLTAPEIRSQDLKAAMSDETSTASTSTLAPVMESDKKDGKVRTRFGKKQNKEKSASEARSASSAGEIVLKNDMADSPVLSEETSCQISPSLPPATISQGDPAAPTAISSSKSSDVIVLEPLDLSQTSEKHSAASLSQSEPFTGIDEHFSTQSSSEIAISGSLQQINEGWDDKEVAREDDTHYEQGSYLQGSSRLYEDYGSKQHKLNLERVHAFLESSGEIEPVDLSVLQDWDGWMIASREIT